MRKRMFPAYIAIFLVLLVHPLVNAQTSARSWYVSNDGDDNNNNGRSPGKAYKTMGKALEGAVSSNVKTITVVGEYHDFSSPEFPENGTGPAEILITGMDKATFESSLYLGSSKGPSKFRIENLTFVSDNANTHGSLYIEGDTAVTAGKDVVFEGCVRTMVGKNAVLTMEANAAARLYDDGIVVSGTAIFKDDVQILAAPKTSSHLTGVTVAGGSFTIQDNVKISGFTYSGVRIDSGSFTMKGKSSISGNSVKSGSSYGAGLGGGIYIGTDNAGTEDDIPIVTLQDDASITNNTAGNYGGGIYLAGGRLSIKDNVVIAGNNAKLGGGIYYNPGWDYGNQTKGGYHDDYGSPYHLGGGSAMMRWTNDNSPLYTEGNLLIGKPSILTIAGNAAIKENQAEQGGGVYAQCGNIAGTLLFKFIKGTRNVDYASAKINLLAAGITMSGGTISNNKADYGAGVYACYATSAPTLIYDAAASARDKTWIFNEGKPVATPAFTLNGGSITGNAAEFVGGGVYTKETAAFRQSGGSITNNSAGDGEGEDIYNPR